MDSKQFGGLGLSQYVRLTKRFISREFIENAVKQVFKSFVAKEHRNAEAGTFVIDV